MSYKHCKMGILPHIDPTDNDIPRRSELKKVSNLTHYFLLPSPSMPDERFVDALIYVCRHSTDGAWGFVVNKPLSVSVGSLLHELDLPASQEAMNTPAMHGGFIRPEAGFVLHTGLPEFASSFAVSENVCITVSKDALNLISGDSLPHFLLCMGFCHWSAGQLEQEIDEQDWLVCPANLEILFRVKFEDRLALAYDKLGINPDKFTLTTGFA